MRLSTKCQKRTCERKLKLRRSRTTLGVEPATLKNILSDVKMDSTLGCCVDDDDDDVTLSTKLSVASDRNDFNVRTLSLSTWNENFHWIQMRANLCRAATSPNFWSFETAMVNHTELGLCLGIQNLSVKLSWLWAFNWREANYLTHSLTLIGPSIKLQALGNWRTNVF